MIDLTGERFEWQSNGHYNNRSSNTVYADIPDYFGSTVLEKAPKGDLPSAQKQIWWRLLCDCGEEWTTYSSDLRHNHKFHCGCAGHCTRPPGETAKRVFYKQSKYWAERSGKTWDITLEEWAKIVQKPCVWCGIIGSMEYKPYREGGMKEMYNGSFFHNGLDRRDSSNKTYRVGLVDPCCKPCNIAKLDRTVKEFKKWLERTARYSLGMERA